MFRKAAEDRSERRSTRCVAMASHCPVPSCLLSVPLLGPSNITPLLHLSVILHNSPLSATATLYSIYCKISLAHSFLHWQVQQLVKTWLPQQNVQVNQCVNVLCFVTLYDFISSQRLAVCCLLGGTDFSSQYRAFSSSDH